MKLMPHTIPHSAEVEGAILGCILLAPDRAPEFLEKLPLAYLHDERHKLIYRAMEKIVGQGGAPDLVTLHQRLGDQIHAAGGLAYLAGLPGLPPSAAHFEDYLAELEPLYARRVLLRMGHEAARLALDGRNRWALRRRRFHRHRATFAPGAGDAGPIAAHAHQAPVSG